MDYGFSPTRGGTLHLSPTQHHRHSFDALGVMHELRRSMSRSPSKRTSSPRINAAQATRSPLSPHPPPSPLQFSVSNLDENTPPAIDGQPPARKPRPALRRSTPIRFNQLTRNVTRSTPRRGLGELGDINTSQEHPGTFFDADDSCDMASITPKTAPPSSWTPHAQQQSAQPPATAPVMGFFAPPDMDNLHKSSPLKRSDGLMNLEQPGLGSPSTKRRSLNGGNFELSRESLDLMAATNNDADSSDDEMNLRLPTTLTTPRRSTQRPILRSQSSRNRRSLELGAETSVYSSRSSKSKRSSLDSAVPTRLFPNAKPTTADQDLGISFAARSHLARSARPPRHPLSHALTPASPSPDRDEILEQTSAALQGHDMMQQHANEPLFTKSLPLGAMRPPMHNVSSLFARPAPADPESLSFDTPAAFKLPRPDPAAFKSTGLISKKYKDVDAMPPPPVTKAMPDTPIKKSHMNFGFTPSPAPAIQAPIPKPRFHQPDFGTPTKSHSTPFGSLTNTVMGDPLLSRRASNISSDGEDLANSPSGRRANSQSSSADDLPPTPTKHTSTMGRPSSLRSSLFGRPSVGQSTFVEPTTHADTDSLFRQTIRARGSDSPHTPADTGFPDPSGLSISPRPSKILSPHPGVLDGKSSPTPETPSMHRQTTTFLGTHHLTMTPSTHVPQHEADPALYARFKKVEWYGRGEFSEVYKVYKPASDCASSYFGGSFSGQGSFSCMTPKPDRVFIVKKSKSPYMSQKSLDRARREVTIMRALGGNDHVVELFDSWEVKGHLYLQTEFCEEGSLGKFLEKVGRKGRLDDFRIWKILLELAQGIQHIHASGFIHLDLKPENIFIDFSGMLKIGDFGMASEWPAPSGIEGEGDRRYMGPETLQGKYDKPADIFALGMIMFEIAGNCEVPDNGASWQQLRSGDFSGLPSLTSASTQSLLHNSSDAVMTSRSLDDDADKVHERFSSPPFHPDTMEDSWQDDGADQRLFVHEEAAVAPSFMVDPDNSASLDKLVQWMMQPDYWTRPTVEQVLAAFGCQWVAARRRSGAVVYEGLHGPPSHMLKDRDQDTDMLDV